MKRFNGTTGAFIDTFTSGGSIRGGVGLGFGPHGNLYVTSFYTSEVKRFDGTTGVFIDNVISGANTWFLTFSKPETVAQPPQVSCATVDTVQGCVHTRTLTYTAIDGCGNKATCSQVIRWTQDTTPPVITGLQDILVHSRAGTNGNRVSYPLPEVTDLCGGPVTLACNPPSGSFFRTGQTPVYCVATDACGNSATNSFTVTVRGVCVEIVEEEFTCTGLEGQNTYRFCFVNNSDRPLGHLTLVNLPDGVVAQPYFMDLTPPVEPGQTGCVSVAVSGLGIQTKLCFQIMAHTPDLEQCCIATHCVEVAFTPPHLTCPPNIEAITASGESKAVVDYTVKAGGQSGSPVTLVCTPPSGSPFPIGTTPVRCVATDACGRTKECSFQITVAAGRGDLWITDTPYYSSVAIDQGREPDPDMTLEQVYQSRGLWVHNDCVAPAGTHLSHQNPRYGQQNCVFAEIKNRGNLPVAGAHVEFYWANAGLGLTFPISWTFMGTASLPTLNPGDTYIATAPWYPAGTGHYCLLARIISIVDPMTYTETPSIWTNVRYNNNLGWRNVNVTDCLRTPGDKVEVRVRNFEPAPKKLTLVFTADQDFLPNGGTAILSPGTTLFQRWMAAGGKGTHVEVINGNEIRFTGSPAVLEDIPFAQNEERIFNLTLRADQPMPVRGSSHTYHAHLQQKLDGETVGGVSYAVITRTYETDTDLDGLPDIEDDDDDNDGIPDEIDDNPMGETECPPSVLTLSRVAGESTLTWNGLGYRLQSSAGLGQAWVDMPGASSPYVLETDGGERLFRLICR